jgi:LIVCS family branched-chain amino acid:cation transporter
MKYFTITVVTGLALFAMFFGTGNIIFPLQLGLQMGDQFLFGLAGFLLSGVGLPLLGIYSVSVCGGDYKDFFNYFGEKTGFALITFIMLIICIFVGTPRTAIVTYSTFEHYLPPHIHSPYVFNALYFLIVYWLAKNDDRLVSVIGRYISPVKIFSLITLIVFAYIYKGERVEKIVDAQGIFTGGFTLGYGTMDLMGAFLFCTTAVNNLKNKIKESGKTMELVSHKIMIRSSLIGGFLTIVVYTGLMLSTYNHSAELQNSPIENLIYSLSMLVFGDFGTIFVCFLVFLASVATASVLSEVATYYCYQYIFKNRLSRKNCLRVTLLVIYGMSILGFKVVMQIAEPILSVMYPVLIAYCLYVIYLKKISNRNRTYKSSIKAASMTV